MKKKHKGGNYEVSQGISSQRKIHSDANGKLVRTGLEGNVSKVYNYADQTLRLICL